MKVPGRAWLEFEVTDCDEGSTVRQTAIFDPVGLLGLAYWYALYPLHQLVFAGVLRYLVNAMERFDNDADCRSGNPPEYSHGDSQSAIAR